MITIISGTNRIGSNTRKVAHEYERILTEKGIKTQFLSLEDMHSIKRDAAFEKIEQEILIPTKAFILVLPEYNGSLPGIFKLLIDNSKPAEVWYYKKALLVGNATGRAGNLRGLDHATNILNHMKVDVHTNKLPISMVNTLMDTAGKFTHEGTLNAINLQIDEFLSFIGS
jgi:chromate reductase, NAD(P)H dehydrogenase (quinone)